MSVTVTPVDFGQGLYILRGGILVEYKNGMYVCSRQGKGDTIEFSRFGGHLYNCGRRVGTIYLDETESAEYHTCYWSMDIERRCECGHGRIPDSIMHEFPTALETITDAAFMYVC